MFGRTIRLLSHLAVTAHDKFGLSIPKPDLSNISEQLYSSRHSERELCL